MSLQMKMVCRKLISQQIANILLFETINFFVRSKQHSEADNLYKYQNIVTRLIFSMI